MQICSDVLSQILRLLPFSTWSSALSVCKAWNEIGYRVLNLSMRSHNAFIFACQRRYYALFERIVANQYVLPIEGSHAYSIARHVLSAGPHFLECFLRSGKYDDGKDFVQDICQYYPDCAEVLLRYYPLDFLYVCLLREATNFNAPLVIETLWKVDAKKFSRYLTADCVAVHPTEALSTDCRRLIYARCKLPHDSLQHYATDPLSWERVAAQVSIDMIFAAKETNSLVRPLVLSNPTSDWTRELCRCIQMRRPQTLLQFVRLWLEGCCQNRILPSEPCEDLYDAIVMCCEKRPLKNWTATHPQLLRLHACLLFQVCVASEYPVGLKELFPWVEPEIHAHGKYAFSLLCDAQHKTWRSYVSDCWRLVPLLRSTSGQLKGQATSCILDDKWVNCEALLNGQLTTGGKMKVKLAKRQREFAPFAKRKKQRDKEIY